MKYGPKSPIEVPQQFPRIRRVSVPVFRKTVPASWGEFAPVQNPEIADYVLTPRLSWWRLALLAIAAVFGGHRHGKS